MITLEKILLPTKKKLIIGLIVGFAVALLFIFANKIEPAITIGIPSWFTTIGEKWVTVVMLAPIFEEALFSILLPFTILWLAYFVFKSKSDTYGIIACFLIIPIVFSIFHASAYAGSLSAQNIQATAGLFIGAFLFRVLILIQLFTGYGNYYGAVLNHALFNGYLVSEGFIIVS